jgi:hypothetical protein
LQSGSRAGDCPPSEDVAEAVGEVEASVGVPQHLRDPVDVAEQGELRRDARVRLHDERVPEEEVGDVRG